MRPICSEDRCSKVARRRGLCPTHYSHHWKKGSLPSEWAIPDAPTVDERFWKKVRKVPGGCWLWTGAISTTGYGSFNAGSYYTSAHRYSYLTLVGPVDAGLHLDHLCHVRRCCNPVHLDPVPPAENAARRKAVQFQHRPLRDECGRGHTMTDAMTVKLGPSAGKRQCRTCWQFRAAAKKKAHDYKRPPAGTKEALWERSRGLCEACGGAMRFEKAVIHHRKLRSQGGGHEHENLLLVHGWCHTGNDKSIHMNPARFYELGHLVRSHDDPAVVPVQLMPPFWIEYLATGARRPRKEHPSRPCVICGTEFVPSLTKPDAKSCSFACRGRVISESKMRR